MVEALFESHIPDIPLLKRGKVRDIYDLNHVLLIITTDRISAFDVVLPTPIPKKGKILTQLTLFWLNFLEKELSISHHLVTGDVQKFPKILQPYTEILKDRSLLVKKAKVIPIEAIVRGYITGSAMKEYKETGKVCGISLPPNLKEADKLPEPIFTPSTKAEKGEHDKNITFKEMCNMVEEDIAYSIKDLAIKIYKKASEYAEKRGIIIADTKLEFGLLDGKLILIDEVLTPDSSRFWPKEEYKPGKPQKSFDKQFIRDWLKSIGWKGQTPPPTLPEDVVKKTIERYKEAYTRLTGKPITF